MGDRNTIRETIKALIEANIPFIIRKNGYFLTLCDAICYDTSDDEFLRTVIPWNRFGTMTARTDRWPIGLVQLDIPYDTIHGIETATGYEMPEIPPYIPPDPPEPPIEPPDEPEDPEDPPDEPEDPPIVDPPDEPEDPEDPPDEPDPEDPEDPEEPPIVEPPDTEEDEEEIDGAWFGVSFYGETLI
jgi:hypothetical protein